MRLARTLALVTALGALAIPALAPAADHPANAWLSPERNRLLIAHQGGTLEAPSNTLYALKRARNVLRADVLEIDVHATADRQLVVSHDTTVDRMTDGTGRIDQMTLAQVQALDAAYWWVEGFEAVRNRPDADYTFRGVATGATDPPHGYTATDFRIPTLREVLTAFPGVLINIEIKRTAPDTAPYEKELADLLAEFGRTDDVMVVAFSDAAVEAFKVFAPDVHTATATGETAAFWASSQGPLPGAPNPRYQALQVPILFENKVPVTSRDFVADANRNGLAVHVWTINDADTMHCLLRIGVQGIMTNRPSVLRKVLDGQIAAPATCPAQLS